MKNVKVNQHEEIEKLPMSNKEFEEELRNIGKVRYHNNCRFHHLLH